jgi:hypothetical protein
MVAIAVAAAPALAASEGADERAKAAESRAFAAIDEERWCDAGFAFLEANELAPTIDYIYNAAQAVDYAGDKKRALKLYAELLGAYPGSERQEAVNQRIRELTEAVGSEGVGEACPEPEPEAAPVVEEEATPAGAAGESAATPESSAGGAILPFGLAGVGGVLLVAGTVTALVGAVPYFGHSDIAAQIESAEQSGADASALQREQSDLRAAWESWGELTVWMGISTAAVGLFSAGAGAAWGAMALAGEEGAE